MKSTNDNIYKIDDVNKLNEIIKKSGSKMEGNCLYEHMSDFIHRDSAKLLRQNLYRLGKRSNNIMEIGFNGGHSNLIFLLANPKARIVNFDICYHKYTEPCFNYLKTKYNVKLIKGDSLVEVPKCDDKFDMIHIDGGHGYTYAFNDIINSKSLATLNTLLIIDDANFSNIKIILDQLVNYKFIKEVDYKTLNLNMIPYHRVFNYIFR